MEINGWFLNSPCLSTKLTSLNGWDCRIHVFQQNRILKVKNAHTNLIYQYKRQISSRNHKAPSQWKFGSVQKSLHIHHCFAWNQNRKSAKEIPSGNYHYQNQVPSLFRFHQEYPPLRSLSIQKTSISLPTKKRELKDVSSSLGHRLRYVESVLNTKQLGDQTTKYPRLQNQDTNIHRYPIHKTWPLQPVWLEAFPRNPSSCLSRLVLPRNLLGLGEPEVLPASGGSSSWLEARLCVAPLEGVQDVVKQCTWYNICKWKRNICMYIYIWICVFLKHICDHSGRNCI